MTVTAMDPNNHNNFVVLTQNSPGTYSTSLLPRLYEEYSVLVRAELAGYGTVEDTVVVNGTNLAPVAEPLTINPIADTEDNISIALVQRRLTNNTNGPLAVTITWGNNIPGAKPYPQSPVFPVNGTIAANGTIDISPYRDYTETFAAGEYELTIVTRTECGLTKNYTLTITNQQNYRQSI